MRIKTGLMWRSLFANTETGGEGNEPAFDFDLFDTDIGGSIPPEDAGQPAGSPADESGKGGAPADPSGSGDGNPPADPSAGVPPTAGAQVTEPPATPAPAEPGDGTPAGEPVATPTTQPPVGQQPQESELDYLRRQINELSAKLNEQGPVTSVKPNVGDPTAGKTGDGSGVRPDEPTDYLKDLDIDEVVARPELLNSILNTAVNDAIEKAVTMVLGNLPSLVQPTIRQTMAMDKKIDQFFSEHKLLGNFRQVVGAVANKLQAEKPQATLDELMPEIAKESYAYLRIDPAMLETVQNVAGGGATPPGTTQTPALPRTPGVRKPPANQGTALEQEIIELM